MENILQFDKKENSFWSCEDDLFVSIALAGMDRGTEEMEYVRVQFGWIEIQSFTEAQAGVWDDGMAELVIVLDEEEEEEEVVGAGEEVEQ